MGETDVTARSTSTFALAVLGCRANQEELDGLRSAFMALGACETPFPGPADVVVVNTCAVTASAQAQSRQEIRKAARRKHGGILVATGCAAQLDPQSLAAIAGVDLVVGNAEKSCLAHLIDGLLRDEGFRPRCPTAGSDSSARVLRSDDPTLPEFLQRSGPIPRNRSRALLKIEDGCNLRCSYCIVTHLRGDPVSRDPIEVLREVRRLVAAGYQEIVLTGINLGLYGVHTSPDGLLLLLRDLEEIPGRFRIRLSSLEPMTISSGLLDFICESSRVCRHFHIPLQSGDDRVLQRMGRPYAAATFARLIGEIARRMPACGLGVDLIAGFPGETEEAFSRTVRLLESLPLSYVHAFAYSERPGTAAAALDERVTHRLRTQRVRALRDLGARLRLRFQERLRGQRCEVLVESVKDGRFEGLTGEYVRLRGVSPQARPGELLPVVAGASLGATVQACVPTIEGG
jgi:threonylcarbamoyladenosine tRNA methylthiotransferase MtaB